jgi:hypothetical protein
MPINPDAKTKKFNSLEEEMADYHAKAYAITPLPTKKKSDLGIVTAPLLLGMLMYLMAGDSSALSPETLTVLDTSSDVIAQSLQLTSDQIVNTVELLKESSKEEIMILAEQAKEVPIQMQAALGAGFAALTAGLYNAKDLWGEKLSGIFDKNSNDDQTQVSSKKLK